MRSMLVLLSALLATSALAQERVRFDDLNLSTERGVEKLYVRITLSARAICGDPEQAVQTYARERIAQCVKATVADTVQRVRNERLLAYARTQ